jgi:hypothetical protein
MQYYTGEVLTNKSGKKELSGTKRSRWGGGIDGNIKVALAPNEAPHHGVARKSGGAAHLS